MAYAFNRLNAALGQPEQADVFGGGQPQGMDQQPGANLARNVSGGAAVGQGGGAGPAPVGDTPTTAAPATNVFQQIAERNKPQSLNAIGDLSAGVSKAVTTAQAEADKYVAGQKVTTPTAKDVSKAGSGNENAFSNIANFLTGPNATAADFNTTAELDTAGLDKLDSRTGVGEYITKQAGAGYDPRLSNFDASLTMADQDFQNSKAKLDKQATKAEKTLTKIDKTAETNAQKSLTSQEKTARAALLAQIKASRDSEIAQAEEAMQFERERRQGMGNSLSPADIAARTAAGNQGMTASYAELAKDPSLAPYLDRARFDMNDANPYITTNQNLGDIGAYIGGDSRDRFDKLNDLFAVGSGGQRAPELAAASAKTGAYNFNQAAYSQALRAAAERIKSGQKPADSGTGKTTKETGGKGPGGPGIYANPAGAVAKTYDQIKKNPKKYLGG